VRILATDVDRESRGRLIKLDAPGKKESMASSVKVRADLRCYFCGYSSARIEGEQGRPLNEARLVQSATGEERAMPARDSLRCSRCNGPLFMEPLEVVRSYKLSVASEPPPRRGRPPRVYADTPPAGTI